MRQSIDESGEVGAYGKWVVSFGFIPDELACDESEVLWLLKYRGIPGKERSGTNEIAVLSLARWVLHRGDKLVMDGFGGEVVVLLFCDAVEEKQLATERPLIERAGNEARSHNAAIFIDDGVDGVLNVVVVARVRRVVPNRVKTTEKRAELVVPVNGFGGAKMPFGPALHSRLSYFNGEVFGLRQGVCTRDGEESGNDSNDGCADTVAECVRSRHGENLVLP